MKTIKHIAPILIAGFVVALGVQTVRAADAILNGNYLRVGVNDSGGLIDSGFNVGINFDNTGTGTYGPYDFLKPGSPFEFYSVGYTAGADPTASAGYTSGNPLGATTTNTSLGTTLSASTTGGAFGPLGLSQNLSYGINSGFIDFSVTLTNTSTDVLLSDVVYARGLDPDQDVYAGGGYATTNTIVNGNLVTGSAPITDWTIGIFSDSPYAHTPTVRADWNRDPYILLVPHNDGFGDYTINMAWNIGTLDPGASATIDFQYRIAETEGGVTGQVPDGASTLGLLSLAIAGLVGFKMRGRHGRA